MPVAAMGEVAAEVDDDDDVVLTRRLPLNDTDGDVLLVMLNRPEKKNAFDSRVVVRLADIFNEISNEVASYDTVINDDGKTDKRQLAAVIFAGEGRSFCAGADLSGPPNPIDQSSDLPHHLRFNPVHQMGRVGVPIIGVMRGHVITGGFELALGCDIILGDTTTTFRDTHVRFGLAPCWGLSQKLSQRIGPGRARIVSLTARPLDAATAHEWGLLDELVEASGTDNDGNDAVMRRAFKLACAIASNNQLMVRRYKAAMAQGDTYKMQEGLRRERELGLAHYTEIVGDGTTFEAAEDFISNDSRLRSQSKL